MISNLSDDSALRGFGAIKSPSSAVTATIVSGVVENNNNNNTNNNNNNNNAKTVTNQLNGLGYASLLDDGFNYSHGKHTESPLSFECTGAGIKKEMIADSYDTPTIHTDFHSYSKSPDLQQSPVDTEMVVDEEEEADGGSVAAMVAAGGGSNSIPDHHARRPMNAFLIFCKRHRPVVREKYPNLENRAITKILGDWWANLDSKDKAPFTELAKQVRNGVPKFVSHTQFLK